ncbi:hypothetical protein ACFL6O_00070 [candidate division KSB1 bacterium]
MRIKPAYISFLILVLFIAGCTTDMDVRNDNDPDTKRVLVTPEDVELLISGSFRHYWFAWNGLYPSLGLSVAADELSSSWGSYIMRDLSEEPRKTFNNTTGYGYRGFINGVWYDNYEVVSLINDALVKLHEGMEFGSPGSTDTERAKAFALFSQGLSYGYLGLYFDKAVIVPIDIELEYIQPEFVPYDDLVDYGIGLLNECINICTQNDFTLPSTWINGLSLTNHDLIKLCRTYIARYMVSTARTNPERQAIDWDLVISNIDNGIVEDFAPIGDDNMWWHPQQYASNWNGWFVADNKFHGPSDTSNNYQNWLDTPVAERNHFINHSADRRVTDDISGVTDGKYFFYFEAQFCPANRGIYHFSRYKFQKFESQYPETYGPMPHITMTEMDMLRAEAYLRGYGGGTKTDVAELINRTRVGIGEMEPLDGTESDLELWRWMCYEKRMETQLTGIAYYDYRGWAGLTAGGERVIHVPSGTPVHFPVPAKELEILMMDNYTFGGVGQLYTTPSLYRAGNIIDMEYIRKAREWVDRNNKSRQTIPERK